MMIRFGYFYIQGKMVIYDLTMDTEAGYTAFVATLSENTAIAFRAIRPETAIERLREWLEYGSTRPAPLAPQARPPQGLPPHVKLPSRSVAAHPHH